MTCGGCVKTVQKVLSGVPGVEAATVDLARGQAEVRHDSQTAPQMLVSAVEDAGFDAQVHAG